MYYRPQIDLKPEEVLDYLRKSQSDDPLLTVEEVLAKHETILDRWAEQHLGGKVPEENKFREVVSGETLKERPEINRLLLKIESPRYKAVKVVDPQRLTRGDLEDIGRLMKLLKLTNTLVIVPDEFGGQRIYDLRDEYDWNALEAELKKGNDYLKYTKKILNRGRLLSISQGNYIGQKPPYGYEKVFVQEGKKKCPTLKIKPDEAEIVRMIFDMYANEDIGCVTIAKRLNEMKVPTRTGALWAQDTLKRMLENEHYLGKVRWNWRKTVTVVEEGVISQTRPQSKVGEYLIYDGKHEAIISEELFQTVREKKGRKHRAKPSTKIRNPLAGLVFCQCGRAMSLRTYKKDGEERSAPRLLCDNQAYCKTPSCLYEEILDRVKEVLKQCIRDFEVRIQNNDGNSAKLHASLIKRLEAKRVELDNKELAQWEAQADPDPSKRMPDHVFKILNEKLLKEKEEVRQALCKAYESMPEPEDYAEKLHRFRDALETLDDPEADAAKKNRLLKDCIQRIDYKREKPVRLTRESPRRRKTINGKRVVVSDFQSGANWSASPIELDVKLKVK